MSHPISRVLTVVSLLLIVGAVVVSARSVDRPVSNVPETPSSGMSVGIVGARGDINLNGLAYDYGDAVAFFKFILYGYSSFEPGSEDIQYAASEINCDTVPASALDLAYMMRLFLGERVRCEMQSPQPAPSDGPLESLEDTLSMADIEVSALSTFDVDVSMRNVDPVGVLIVRLTYDPAVIEPVAIDGPLPNSVDAELLREPLRAQFLAVTPEPGVVTMMTQAIFDHGLDAIAPGNGPAIRLTFQSLPGTEGMSSALQFELNPDAPQTHNTLADTEAMIWKRPTQVNGSVSVAPCSCPNQGDMNADGHIDSVDLNGVIQVIFFSNTNLSDPNCPASRADFNADGVPDAVDLNKIISHVYFNGPGPVDPCL